jgi:parvulin-like peptidyl-prolyl isomerase
VATVDSVPVYAGEVADAIQRLRLGDKLPESDLPRLEAQVLSQLIDERLALLYLVRHGEAVSKHLVDAALAELTSKLQQKKIALDDYLAQRGFTEAALRTQFTWRMSWERYLAKRVTDEVLQKHFDANRRDFDGTRVRVRHILFRPPKASPDEVAAAKQRAAILRDQILANKITFTDAAAKYSAAPTAKEGGDVGLISRYGEMVEPFAAAAFALEIDEISPPVETQFGVHLIQCTEIKPGDKKWTDVADRLRSAVIQRGFRAIVRSQRPRVKVEFTGRAPYFDPATGQLKLPAA